MNWDQIEGRWHQIMGRVKSKWGKLTDDDIKNVAGKKDVLIGKIQERYGVLKDDAEEQVDAWIERYGPMEGASKRSSERGKRAS